MFSAYKQHARFFKENAQGLAEDNLRTLCWVDGVTALFILVFVPLAAFVIEIYHATWHYGAFFVADAVFTAVGLYLRRRGNATPAAVTALCTVNCCMLLWGCMLVDIFPIPEQCASFIPVVVVVLPALFALPYRILAPLILGNVALYIALLFAVKPPLIAQLDTFNVLFAVPAACVVNWALSRLRLRDHAEKRLYLQRSNTDPLTHLLNRAVFEQKVEQFLAQRGAKAVTGNRQEPCALLLLDLDNFKAINDRLGHQKGDWLLQQTANLLARSVADGRGLAARMGGDEFMVLLYHTSANDAGRFCDELQTALHGLTDENGIVPVGGSIGVALAPAAACFAALYHAADAAVYEAKLNGKGQHCIRTV